MILLLLGYLGKFLATFLLTFFSDLNKKFIQSDIIMETEIVIFTSVLFIVTKCFNDR
jgi:hypothetical protein